MYKSAKWLFHGYDNANVGTSKNIRESRINKLKFRKRRGQPMPKINPSGHVHLDDEGERFGADDAGSGHRRLVAHQDASGSGGRRGKTQDHDEGVVSDDGERVE
jgi:hypothetical protein